MDLCAGGAGRSVRRAELGGRDRFRTNDRCPDTPPVISNGPLRIETSESKRAQSPFEKPDTRGASLAPPRNSIVCVRKYGLAARAYSGN